MGNHKLRLSNIIPSVWFHKGKEATTKNNTNTKSKRHSNPSNPEHCGQRKSYHISRPLNPKSSSLRSTSTTTTTTTTSSSELHCFDRMAASWTSSSSNDDDDDAVIGVDRISLPPIITQHKKFSDLVAEMGAAKEPRKQRRSPVRRPGSPRVRVRIQSPRQSKRVEKPREVRASDGVAVMKTSADPERDFRESMVEMIVENQVSTAKDFEELLACYLSLNSAEYHHLIVHVFKQIWFGFNQMDPASC